MNVFRISIGMACLLAATNIQAAEKLDPETALPALQGNAAWTLVWHDEFDGAAIDESKWEIIGDAPRRDAFWIKADSYLDGKGCLVLRTNKEPLQDGAVRYTSGAVRTRGKFEHRYGYWEARCRFHTQPGHWPAFWLMPADGISKVGNGGKDGAEIDIMEKAWLASKVNHAIHWDGYDNDHKSDVKEVETPGLNEGFHTFGLWWTDQEYVFYVDGKETWRSNGGGACQVPLYVKLTEEVGPWAGDIKTAALPDYFTVDYVRVFDLTPTGGK